MLAYDANGNVTNMPGVGTIAYDARNRITGTGGVPTRGYDPGNRKIWWKDSNGITFVDYWLPNGEKLVTYKIDEAPYVNDQRYPGPVQFLTVTRTLYFAGRQVKVEGRYGVGGYVEWPQPDRLSSNARHHPYGEERSTSSTEYKFATYQREASGLDYALNRYYSSVYGRFLSSDPYRASGGPSDPGSWNRYAYVQGDPVNYKDRSGLSACPADTENSVWVCGGGSSEGGGGGGGTDDMQEPPGNSDQKGPAQGGGEGTSVLGSMLMEAQTRIGDMLKKEKCSQAIGASTPTSAIRRFNTVQIGFADLGYVGAAGAPRGRLAQWRGYLEQDGTRTTRSIIMNTMVNWADPDNSLAKTADGSAVLYRAATAMASRLDETAISTSQFLDIVLMHELGHAFGKQHGNTQNSLKQYDKDIWINCFK